MQQRCCYAPGFGPSVRPLLRRLEQLRHSPLETILPGSAQGDMLEEHALRGCFERHFASQNRKSVPAKVSKVSNQGFQGFVVSTLCLDGPGGPINYSNSKRRGSKGPAVWSGFSHHRYNNDECFVSEKRGWRLRQRFAKTVGRYQNCIEYETVCWA